MNKTEFRNSLIRAATPAELRLKYFLDNSSLKDEYEFQAPIDKYFIDFYFAKKHLAIEIDGSSHIGHEEYDKKRNKDLFALGIKTIRISNKSVFYATKNIMRKILTSSYRPVKRSRSSFIKDHVNSDWAKKSGLKMFKKAKRGSQIVRRKRNAAAELQECKTSEKSSSACAIGTI